MKPRLWGILLLFVEISVVFSAAILILFILRNTRSWFVFIDYFILNSILIRFITIFPHSTFLLLFYNNFLPIYLNLFVIVSADFVSSLLICSIMHIPISSFHYHGLFLITFCFKYSHWLHLILLLAFFVGDSSIGSGEWLMQGR